MEFHRNPGRKEGNKEGPQMGKKQRGDTEQEAEVFSVKGRAGRSGL